MDGEGKQGPWDALRPEAGRVCRALLAGLHAVPGEKPAGAYLHGAVASPEGGNPGDTDFRVVPGSRFDEREKAEPPDLHDRLVRGFRPLGAEGRPE